MMHFGQIGEEGIQIRRSIGGAQDVTVRAQHHGPGVKGREVRCQIRRIFSGDQGHALRQIQTIGN